MDAAILIPSIVLWVILLGIYLARCHRERQAPDIGVVISTVLKSSGIVCGLFLMVGTVYPPAQQYLKGIDIYIFVAGVAVLFVSAHGIYKDMFQRDAQVVKEGADHAGT